MFTLAHLTDPHLAPMPRPGISELAGKRLIGYLNWLCSRKAIHSRSVLDAIVADMQSHSPTHIAVGGDLVNISLAKEFMAAHAWLETLGPPEKVSVIPGNHDAYARVAAREGLERWKAYMRSHDTHAKRGAKKHPANASGFPTVRRFGNIALIGLSTAVKTPPFTAWGRIDQDQLDALERILANFDKQELFRVVVIHHPPLPGLTRSRRALREANQLQDVLVSAGAELVLYGHNHAHAINVLPGKSGTIPVVGAPSASSRQEKEGRLARYNLFNIWYEYGRWRCKMTGRGLHSAEGKVGEIEQRMIIG